MWHCVEQTCSNPAANAAAVAEVESGFETVAGNVGEVCPIAEVGTRAAEKPLSERTTLERPAGNHWRGFAVRRLAAAKAWAKQRSKVSAAE